MANGSKYVVVFTKVRGFAKSESLQTLVLGPLQKLLLPLTFCSNDALLPRGFQVNMNY